MNYHTRCAHFLGINMSRHIILDLMRSFALFLAIGLTTLFARDIKAQSKITLDLNEVSIETLLEEIQKNSEYIFFYKDGTLPTDDRISVTRKDATLQMILGPVLEPYGLGFKVRERQVIIFKKPSSSLKLKDGARLQFSVSGTVVDQGGLPLPGASVLEKGTTNGVQTDFDGNFSLEVADENAVIVISYIGFASKEINVAGQSNINVVLEESAAALDEIVVMGYSTQTRGDLTGSVASVDMSEATKAPIVNAAEALEGRVSGVSMINSGVPGSAPTIRIRGFGSTNGNDPLFIIDGVQTTDGSILNSIDPGDIQQMNVLKDGAASIYGARASNGVIIITTKNGGYNLEQASVSLDMYSGFSRVSNLPDLLNAQQHGEMIFQSLVNDGLDPSHPQYGDGSSPVVPDKLIGTPVSVTTRKGGNWFDDVFRSAPTQNISLRLENGNSNAKYSVTASYLNREGIQLESSFKRALTRVNSEFKIGDKVRIGQHLNVSYANSSSPKSQNTDFSNSPVMLAMRNSPLLPVYADDGSFAGTYSNSLGLANPMNPVANLKRAADDFYKTYRILGDIYGSYEIMDGLTFKSSMGGDIELRNSRSFLPKNPENAQARTTNALTEADASITNWIWTNTLNYNKTFGDHSVNALAGIEAVETRSKQKSQSVTDFLFEDPDFYLLDRGSGATTYGFVGDNTTSLFSVFGSVNYSYSSKYFLTATLRRDTSSNFMGDNKSDIFPALSLGWQISDEDWFDLGAINRLKLKASYGELGNQAVPTANPTITISQIDPTQSNYVYNGSGTPTTGAIVSAVGNPDLTWETSQTSNIGFDLGLWDNKLSFGFEYFKITTKDLISQDLTLISTTAIDANAPFVNVGGVQNTGFDLNLGYQDQTDSGFSYGVDVNVSSYKNKVTDLINEIQFGNSGFRGGAITATKVGEPISSFYGFDVVGIFNSEAEVGSAPSQGFEAPSDGVGRFQYRDVNGDNVINDKDRTFIGSPHPDFTYGINLNIGYRNWDMSAFFSGVQGRDVYNYAKALTDFPTFFNGNRSTRVLDSWTPDNPDATLPALTSTITNNETSPNSYFIEDASFLRLKNMQIGYSLPEAVLETLGMTQVRLYIQGSNIFTITNYNGLDPEIPIIITDGSVDNLTQGVDAAPYPLSQVYTFGVNLKF